MMSVYFLNRGERSQPLVAMAFGATYFSQNGYGILSIVACVPALQ